MNERIKELMVQSGARFEFLHGVHYDDFQYRKFAELIVNECGDIAYKAYWDAPATVRGTHIKTAIKDHFGVK